MAFSKQPAVDTYQTKPVQLFQQLDKRASSANTDNDYLNCYFEIIQNRVVQDQSAHAVKRPGTVPFSDVFSSTNFRGMIHWEDQDRIYVAVDDDIVVINASTGAIITTLNAVFLTTTGEVGFTFFYYDDTSTKVVATDGTRLITIDSLNVVVTAADPDMPSPHIPDPVFLDGYIFLAKSGTADIYNSNLNDPLNWTPGDFLSAEMFPDTIRAIAKLNNYLLAFGSETIEYFWDAGNASGSPLQRNDTPIKLVGFLGGLAQLGNQMYFVGKSYQSVPTIYQLEDFKIKDVGTNSIRKYLQSTPGLVLTVKGTIVSGGGNDFYVLGAGTLTYVLDLKTELWFRWAYQGTNSFPVEAAFSNDITLGNTSIIYLHGQNRLFFFDPSLYRDNGVDFLMRVVTDNQVYDSYNQKYMNRLTVHADRPTTAPADMQVSWTDDDYQTFSPAQTLALNQELPCIYRLGRFRRRAIKFEFTSNNPLRIQAVEVDLNLGNW